MLDHSSILYLDIIQDDTDKDNSQDGNGKTVDTDSTSERKSRSKASFVSQIFSAIKTADSAKNSDQNVQQKKPELVADDGRTPEESVENASDLPKMEDQSPNQCTSQVADAGKVDSPGFISRWRLGFSANSAFAPIKSSQPEVSAVITNKGNVTIRSEKKSSKTLKVLNTGSINSQTDLGVGKGELSTVEVKVKESDDQQLSNQVRNVIELFKQVVHVAKLIEKALRSSLQDLRSEK